MELENVIDLLKSQLEDIDHPRAKTVLKQLQELDLKTNINDSLVLDSLYYLAKKIPILISYREPWRSKEFRLFLECFTLSDYYKRTLNTLIETTFKGVLRKVKIPQDKIIIEFYPGSGIGIEIISKVFPNKLAIMESCREDLDFVVERLEHQGLNVMVYETEYKDIGEALSESVGIVLIVSPITWFYRLSALIDKAYSILEEGGYILGMCLLDSPDNILKPFMSALGEASILTYGNLEMMLISKYLSRTNIKVLNEFIIFSGMKKW